MGEPSEMAVVPAGGREPAEPYLSRWGAQAEQRRWPLHAGVATIGRGPSADVVIDGDLQVSRLHSTLERVAGVWTIVDNGLSRNGTFVNDRRVAGRVQLHDRDEIRVGGTVLTFCAPATGAAHRAHRAVQAVQGRAALCDAIDQPADRRRAVAEPRCGENPPTYPVPQVRHRPPTPEPEARAAGRDGAAARAGVNAQP